MNDMAKGKSGKTRTLSVRVTEGEYETILQIVKRVEKRFDRSSPDASAVSRELMRLRPDYYVNDEDREYVRQRMEAGHPPIMAEDESPVKKAKRGAA